MPFESLLGADLLAQMAADPFVASIRAQPETFVWRDGTDGRRRRYTPDLLAVMTDGSKVYRSVRPHALLLRDPELSGRRPRIELECAARGAAFEIWTEREIRESTCGWPLLRVASAAEATVAAGLPPRSPDDGSASAVPGIVLRIADRLGLWVPWQGGDTFFARSMLTGILMAFRCKLDRDPVTGLLVWRPDPRGA
ncbi:TnsA endonuclease N-terminal domain-containing protein [Aureimonas sp. ME7]|uniref:TnsA endonuclease N-terminal domain-containing protein n=1 Tax=Aureimonas sp. ME7 TaxID=2744252 RepID=UPI0015F457B8|nr:TnsA endonuclease N-terminal domain-containing protein [Aureimonas sp. ME7]